MNNNFGGRYTVWLAHYFDDFMGARCIPDDMNATTATSIVHTSSHYGNPLNGEAPLNPRYRFSYVERGALTGAYTTTVGVENDVVGTSTGEDISGQPLLHNSGVQEWLTHDPMRIAQGNTYIGRANLRYPDSIPHANRFRYDPSGDYGNGEDSLTGDDRFIWFTNGYAFRPSQDVGGNIGRYWVPTMDWDSSYGRRNVIEHSFKADGSHSTGGYFDGNEGRPASSPQLGSDESLMCQQVNLVGVLAGEAIPRTRSSAYKDATDSNLGGNGTQALYAPLKSPSGKPFLCIQTYRANNTYRPVMFYEGPLNCKGDGDIFHMRISLDGVDAHGNGDACDLRVQDGTYKLRFGFGQVGADLGLTLDQDGYTYADPGSYQSAVTLEFTISSLQANYPYVASTSSADSTYSADERWSDIDIALDFTNQKYYYYVDGAKVSGPVSMGTKLGAPWEIADMYGWELSMKNSADDNDCMYMTCLDRVAVYHPLNDSVVTDASGEADKASVLVESMSINKQVNQASTMQIEVLDDGNDRPNLLSMFASGGAGGSELVLWYNTEAIGRYKMLWRGDVTACNVKQSNKDQTKNITIQASDVLKRLNNEMIAWDIGADSVSPNQVIQHRNSEMETFRESMYFGVRKLKPLNPTLGLGREQDYSKTTDQRMQLGSAHPIQIYNNEDTNGPNDAEDQWAGYSSGITGVGTEIQNRSIHSEWVRDLCKSKWFAKKFGKIANHRLGTTGQYNFGLNTIKTGSSLAPTSTNILLNGSSDIYTGRSNVGLLQMINDRSAGDNTASALIMDVFKPQTTGYFLTSPHWANQTIDSSQPTESLYVTSANVMVGGSDTSKTVNKVEVTSTSYAKFTTSAAHSFTQGDMIIMYGLSTNNVEPTRQMSGTLLAASNDNGYGLDWEHENFYYVASIPSSTTFTLFPSSYTDTKGNTYYFSTFYDTYIFWQQSRTQNAFATNGESYENTLGVDNTNIDFVTKPFCPIAYAQPTSGTSPSGNLAVDHTVNFKAFKISDWGGSNHYDSTGTHTAVSFDIQVHMVANQIGRTYPAQSLMGLRYIDNDYKHCWVLFADMRNDGFADADGGHKTKSWGALYPAFENYEISLVYAEHLLGENLEDRPVFTDLKVGEEIDLWEIDASVEPFSGNTFASLGSADSWESKAGSFLLIDCSPFFNLNTEANYGNISKTSGGNKTLGDFTVDVEGVPILLDNYWRQAPPTGLNSETPITQHPNAHRFMSSVTALTETTANSNGATQYIGANDTTMYLNNAYYWPQSSFKSGATGSDQLQSIGMIRGLIGNGAEQTESLYYYTWTHKEEGTIASGSAYTAGATSIVLTDGSRFDTSGTGSVNGLTFQWTGKTGTHTLTGVTGPALAADHPAGSIVCDNILKGVFIKHIPDSQIDPANRYDSIKQAMWRELESAQIHSSATNSATNAQARYMRLVNSLTTSSTLIRLGHTSGVQMMDWAGNATVSGTNRGYGIVQGDSFEYQGKTDVPAELTSVALLSQSHSTTTEAQATTWRTVWRTAIGNRAGALQVKSGSSSGNTATGNFDEIQIYNTCSASQPNRLMMQVDGYMKSENSGTFYESDKIRFLQNNGATISWLSQSGLSALSDINNVPLTNNMTITQAGYSGATDLDSFGSVQDARGRSKLAVLNEMLQASGTGITQGLANTFSLLVGRDGRIEFRPKYNSGFTFNTNNLKMSNMSIQNVKQVDGIRVYYNDGTSFVDWPGNANASTRWKIVDYSSVRSSEEALALAKKEYNKNKSSGLEIDAQITRYTDSSRFDKRGDLMLNGGRYGYVADVACRQFGSYGEKWTQTEGGCIFTGPQNALDGNLYESIQDSGNGYEHGNKATTRQYSAQTFYTWWGAKSVSYAMQMVHLPKDMPLVSETTGEELRIHIAITGDGTDSNPEFVVEFVDYTFDDTKSNGDPAGSMWASGKPKLASQSHATNTESSVKVRGNGFYEVGVPTTYWASHGGAKMVISVNYDYLHDVMLYRNGHNGRTDANIRKRRRNAHDSATVDTEFTVGGGSYGTGSTTITHSSSTAIQVGMEVSGTNIPSGAYVASITDATHFVLSATPSGSGSGATLTFSSATNSSLFPLGLRRYNYGGWANQRAEWYAPRLHVCEDINFQPATYVTYTDAKLGLSNKVLVIRDLTYRVSENTEQVVFKLVEDESRSADNVAAYIFPDTQKGRQDPKGGTTTSQKPVDEGDPGYQQGSKTGGRSGSDAPNTKVGQEQSGDNRPFSPYASGVDTGKNTNSTVFMGSDIGALSHKAVNTNMLTKASFAKNKKKIDLGSVSDFGILGQEKPTQAPSSTHSIEGVDAVTSPASGNTVVSSEGIVFPGNTGGAGELSLHSHTLTVRIPNDATNGGFGLYATYSLGGTVDERAVLETTFKCIDTGLSDTQSVTLTAGKDNKFVTLFAPTTMNFTPGNRLEITITRRPASGSDNAYYSSVRLHTTEIQYMRKSIVDDNSQSDNMKPYSGSLPSVTDVSEL